MVGVFFGLDVGKNIGTSETVNGLFGIADDVKIAIVVVKKVEEYGALLRGGVLKFVDESRLKFFSD